MCHDFRPFRNGLPVLLLCCFAFTQTATPAPSHTPSGCKDCPPITAFVHAIYVDGFPIKEASHYRGNQDAISTLGALLQEDTERAYWSNIVLTLGVIGNHQTTEILTRFLARDQTPNHVLSHEEFLAKTNVLLALGYTANKASNSTVADRAQRLLMSGLQPDHWHQTVTWQSPTQATTKDRDLYLASKAAFGLALSARARARDALHDLQQHLRALRKMPAADRHLLAGRTQAWHLDISVADLETLQTTVDYCLRVHSLVRKIGLDAYTK